jgi:hypothetical protein
MYIDAMLKATHESISNLGATDQDSKLAVGAAWYNRSLTGHENWQLSLFKISKTSQSVERIEKIYQQERVLFQPGAKCTLGVSEHNHTSDAVTALTYDSTTDLLYVCTSDGTNMFAGLRRVANDPESVTTCIDAQDELVVKR